MHPAATTADASTAAEMTTAAEVGTAAHGMWHTAKMCTAATHSVGCSTAAAAEATAAASSGSGVSSADQYCGQSKDGKDSEA
jgi:hypothetical protein